MHLELLLIKSVQVYFLHFLVFQIFAPFRILLVTPISRYQFSQRFRLKLVICFDRLQGRFWKRVLCGCPFDLSKLQGIAFVIALASFF
jgi:hypothetical protein